MPEYWEQKGKGWSDMKRGRRELFMIVLSIAFLCVYLSVGKITRVMGNKVMNVEVLSMEKIAVLCEEKEDVFMEPEITLGGSKIAYDSEQNLLLIPQDLSKEYFDGTLRTSDGKLCFLEDEALGNKGETIRENKVLRLFWIRDTKCWMYNVYFTGMPVISITSAEATEEENKEGNIWVYDQYRSTAQFQSAECSWHLRGATALNYEKSSYRLTLTDRKLSFLGMRRDDDWILHALYDDEGLIHNKLSYDVWREIAASNHVAYDEGICMEYAELFMDNEYMGVYGLSERIDKKALHLRDRDILYKCRDQTKPGKDDFYQNLTEEMHPVFVWKYPKDFGMEDWAPLMQWVSIFLFDGFEDFTSASTLLNMENAVDYNLFNLLICGMDNMMKNIYFLADYQEDGSYEFIKIPWDLNMTWGNSWIDDYDCNFNCFQEKNFESDSGWTTDMYRLYEWDSKRIGQALYDRWQQLRQKILTKENLFEKLDTLFSYLNDSGANQRNQQKWPSKGEYWREDYIYEYVDRRIDFLDNYIGQMRG